MSLEGPRLRGNAKRRSGPYPLGLIPDNVIFDLGKQIVLQLAIGKKDFTGDEFGTFFANAIDGNHKASPLGVADVDWKECAWSVKTVKASNPYRCKTVRLISGRNSPAYSVGITDWKAKPDVIGKAVLEIWNARVNEALNQYNDLRILVLVRSIAKREFCIFEEEAQRYIPTDYEWRVNSSNNLLGYDKRSDTHRFTWQPHGSQFTIIRHLPVTVRCFQINHVIPVFDGQYLLDNIGYDQSWITLNDNV